MKKVAKLRIAFLLLFTSILTGVVIHQARSQARCYCEAKGDYVLMGGSKQVYVCPLSNGTSTCLYLCEGNIQ